MTKIFGMVFPSLRCFCCKAAYSGVAVSTLSGTNCVTNGARLFSVFSLFRSAWQGGHVFLPATTNIVRPVSADIFSASARESWAIEREGESRLDANAEKRIW